MPELPDITVCIERVQDLVQVADPGGIDVTGCSPQAFSDRLRAQAASQANRWPDKITAFHPAMAVPGRFGQPCPTAH